MVAEKPYRLALTWLWTKPGPSGSSQHADSSETLPSIESGKVASNNQAVSNRERWTRDLMIVGLILGWGASLTTLSTAIHMIASGPVRIPYFLFARVARIGASMIYGWKKTSSPYLSDHRVYLVSEPTMVIIPLFLQFAITCISSCLDSIHATTLRWAMWREGRLRHNTNLRLFTTSRQVGSPNGWPANTIWAVGHVLAYSGATIMTFPVTVIATVDIDSAADKLAIHYDGDPGPDRFGLDFNGWGLLGLGTGLLFQAIICTWCLIHERARYVESWSGNPLATARTCRGPTPNSDSSPTPASDHRSGRNSEPTLRTPTSKQPSMRDLIPATRTIANWIWAIFALYALFALTVALVAVRIKHTASLDSVRRNRAPINFAGIWQFFAQVQIKYSNDSVGQRREWAGLLVQCAGLSILLFGLHLIDVLGGLARDEAIWRRAATGARGTNPDSNMLMENVRNWPVLVIFVYKSLIPWVFSFGFSALAWVFMATLPLVTIALLFLTLALLAEYLIRVQPKGSQPSTYGDIHALVVLVDEWDHERLFWGDKGTLDDRDGNGSDVRIAGTAGHRLADLQADAEYRGLDWQPGSGRE